MTASSSPIVVVPLRPEDVPQDFVCAICLSIPIHPWVVRECHHVFCKDCIRQCLAHHQTSCPVCRSEFCDGDGEIIAPMCTESPLAHRIWTGIGVKCQHHDEGCGWTGSLSDYEAHTDHCKTRKSKTFRTDRTIKMYKEIIQKLRVTVQRLRAEGAEKDLRILELERELEFALASGRRSGRRETNLSSLAEMRRRTEVAMWEETAESMRTELDQLKTVVANTIETPWTNGRGGYAYDKHNVVKLTKLVCQNLEQKPRKIDSNKIFNCIHHIVLDLRRRATADHPAHFYIDVRMLVCVCLASSTWFTANQMGRIRELAQENGWSP